MTMTNATGEIGWNDSICVDESYGMIADGNYKYEIVDVEKGRHEQKPGGKMPSCNKAIITLRVLDNDGNPLGTMSESIFMTTNFEWKIKSFARSISKQKTGDVKIDWDNLYGETGACKVYTEKYRKDDGTEGTSNRIQFLKDLPAVAKAGFDANDRPAQRATY